MTMTEFSKWTNDDTEAMSNPKIYCFGCLCDNNEKQIRSFTFVCGPLKEIFQKESINLCYLCKRIAQHTQMFIQSVQINQILLENFSSVADETLKSVKLQTQPLVSLKQVSNDVIELSENDVASVEESFCVVNNNKRENDIKVKIELKEEAELLENLEAEFVNEDDEFPDMYVKEEEDLPLNTMVKEELGIESIDNLNLLKQRSTKKKILKKKGANKTRIEMPEAQIIYITRSQCLEERARLSKDQQYLSSLYKCSNCIKGFNFKGSFDTHMEKHNENNGAYECDICKQRLDSDDKLVNHMRCHSIRYKCPLCGITRHCRKTVKDHYSEHHLGANHKCLQCFKVFKRKSSLARHVAQRHVRRERVTCAYCARSYADKAVLKAHMIMKHSQEVSAVELAKKYICPECGMGFKTPSQLRNHSIKHSDTREFYCVECDKSFKSESILKTHLRTAAIHCNYKELPLCCLHCEKRFLNRRDVERHMNRVHLNVKPFSCDRCDKAYVNAWALKEHKRYIHEGYKRPLQYQCPMCDKAFDRNQILKSHIRTHTGERPYQCPKCPAQFSQASILRTHDRLIHLKLTRDGRPKMSAIK